MGRCLSEVAARGQTHIVRTLLENGKLLALHQEKPLIEAARSGFLDVATLLIENGAEADPHRLSHDKDTESALTVARRGLDVPMTRLLLEAKASILYSIALHASALTI